MPALRIKAGVRRVAFRVGSVRSPLTKLSRDEENMIETLMGRAEELTAA